MNLAIAWAAIRLSAGSNDGNQEFWMRALPRDYLFHARGSILIRSILTPTLSSYSAQGEFQWQREGVTDPLFAYNRAHLYLTDQNGFQAVNPDTGGGLLFGRMVRFLGKKSS